MASALGHALASTGIATWNRKLSSHAKFWLWMAALAILPDIDASWNRYAGYESPWGHRGITHSILFAIGIGGMCARFAFPKRLKSTWIFFSLSILSHGLLDACTNGGRGVGFFIPFSDERFFFPYHPIEVSPLGIARFFTARAITILGSEAFWIGIPVAISFALRKGMTKQSRSV